MTSGDDKHYKATRLLEDSIGLPTSNRLSLPTIMLRAMIRQKNRPNSITRLPRCSIRALRLVHSVSLAIYLGVTQEFFHFAETNPMAPLHVPSMSNFLDILHPWHPVSSSVEAAESIMNRCRAEAVGWFSSQ